MKSPYSLYSRFRKRFGPRRFQLYAVGPGKSGSNSLANLFRSNYRAAHEADARIAIDTLIRYRNGKASEQEVREYIVSRDNKYKLEMDSASYNGYFAPYLVDLFPNAQFVLSVRDCFAWANSSINQILNRPEPQAHWIELRRVLFGDSKECTYCEEEAVLREHSLSPLKNIFSVWAEAYGTVLSAVPNDRILVLEINDIGKRLGDIADFARVQANTLDAGLYRSYQTPKDFGLLSRLDGQFVNAVAEQTCGALMRELYPSIPCEVESFVDI